MARRLLAGGHAVTVWNRTPSRAAALASDGARIAATPADAVQDADIVVVMLGDHAAIEATLLPPEAAPDLADKTVLQMGTITPDQSRDLAARLATRDAHYLEAPVLGSLPEAKSGTLQVMVGGDHALFERWKDLIGELGTARLVGPVGHAATIKLALNQMIATMTGAFSLSLGLLERSGVSSHDFREILRGSALSAPTFEKKLPRMLASDFGNPNFPLKHLLKDMDLFVHTARTVGLEAPSLEALASVLRRGVDEGSGECDYSILFRLLCPRDTEGG